MNRRDFISSAAAFAVSQLAYAQNCRMISPYASVCTAQVNIPQLIAAINVQQCPEWCWAACISMIFAFYGHPIPQAEIVRQTYGNVVCFPAGTTRTIGNDLSRNWIDSAGRRFTSRVVAAYDPANGINAINNAVIVQELQTSHPLLYCNSHHAMVNYGVDYIPPQWDRMSRASQLWIRGP